MGERVVVFGDVIDDILVVPQEPIRDDTDTTSSIRFSAGGSAANTASWLGALGAQVDFVGMVGAGDIPRHSAVLESFGVTPRLLSAADLPTGTIVVIVDGQHRAMLTERGANDLLSPDDVSDALLDSAGVVHFTGYSLFGAQDRSEAVRRLIARCVERGVPVSVDPGSAGFLESYGAERFLETIAGATLFFPSLEEARFLTGLETPDQMMSVLRELFPLVALTMGERGVLLGGRGLENLQMDAPDTVVVDPTGAGDAFSAGFLRDWVTSRDRLSAARSGSDAAVRAVGTIGGRPPLS